MMYMQTEEASFAQRGGTMLRKDKKIEQYAKPDVNIMRRQTILQGVGHTMKEWDTYQPTAHCPASHTTQVWNKHGNLQT
jgi:hypothetical protein